MIIGGFYFCLQIFKMWIILHSSMFKYPYFSESINHFMGKPNELLIGNFYFVIFLIFVCSEWFTVVVIKFILRISCRKIFKLQKTFRSFWALIAWVEI